MNSAITVVAFSHTKNPTAALKATELVLAECDENPISDNLRKILRDIIATLEASGIRRHKRDIYLAAQRLEARGAFAELFDTEED